MFFDTFLDPIVEDLKNMERGMDVRCHDGLVRRLRAFVLFVTADWPAASKLMGFASHNAKLFLPVVLQRGKLYPTTSSLLCNSRRREGLAKSGIAGEGWGLDRTGVMRSALERADG